jgi:hypothetical protein
MNASRIRTSEPPRSGLLGSAALPVAWNRQLQSANASGRRSFSQSAVSARRSRQSGSNSIRSKSSSTHAVPASLNIGSQQTR